MQLLPAFVGKAGQQHHSWVAHGRTEMGQGRINGDHLAGPREPHQLLQTSRPGILQRNSQGPQPRGFPGLPVADVEDRQVGGLAALALVVGLHQEERHRAAVGR